jgi:hypothetical protein
MGTADPLHWGKVYIWGILDVPGQRMVMPEGLGKSGPTPSPASACPKTP